MQSDYLIINDDFNTALGELHAVVQAQRLRLDVQQHKHAELLSALLC